MFSPTKTKLLVTPLSWSTNSKRWTYLIFKLIRAKIKNLSSFWFPFFRDRWPSKWIWHFYESKSEWILRTLDAETNCSILKIVWWHSFWSTIPYLSILGKYFCALQKYRTRVIITRGTITTWEFLGQFLLSKKCGLLRVLFKSG